MSKAFERDLGASDGSEVKAVIRLDELFTRPLVDNESAREALAGEVIDLIRDKAEKFGGRYSDAYAESLAFKAFGKSKGNVNLTQTGAMLAALDVLAVDDEEITIGWEPDSLDGKKAHGHITGSVGKKRDFFKVTVSELKAIAKKYEDRLTTEETAQEEAESDFSQDILSALRGGRGLNTLLERLNG